MDDHGEITQYLARLREGDDRALDELIPLVYAELRALAQSYMKFERTDHTLSATGLVHEAYARLAMQRKLGAADRVQFLGIAGTTMRRLLVDWARGKKREKRGGGAPHVPLDEAQGFLSGEEADEVIALNEALERLAKVNPRGAQVVECRFFGGLNARETADHLGVSSKTVSRDWTLARAWLRKEVAMDLGSDPADSG